MNVIVLLADTLRRDAVSAYEPTPVPTPAFERLADLGVVFDQHYIGSYPCMPARHELWTGRYEFPFRGWGPVLPGEPTLPRLLSQSGVATMLITDHYHLFQPGAGNYHFGFEGWEFIRGQEDDAMITPESPVLWPGPGETKVHRRWERYFRNTQDRRNGLHWKSPQDTFCARTLTAASQWLRDNPTPRRPFFLLVDCFDPHEPFDPPSPFRERAGAPPAEACIPWPIYGRADRYTPEELAGIRRLYSAEVALVDDCFGRLLETCADLGRLDDTVILVTTDHGHLFGEHGMIGKPSATHGDSTLYRPLGHIPFLAYHPESRGGRLRVPHLTQTVDLFATVADLLGVPLPEGTHGRSLVPHLLGQGSAIRPVAAFGKFGESIAVTDGILTLHQWPPTQDNTPLYWYGPEAPSFLRPRGVGPFEPAAVRYPIDWVRGPMQTQLLDSGETHDRSVELPADAARLRQALVDWLRAIGAPPSQFERLGLIERRMAE